MLTVYGRATSSNVQAVMWGAAELGLAPERLDYGHKYGGTDSPEFKAMSPHALVPVLKDGDLAVWESSAILRYLAARYGDGGAFWPADPAARAPVDMWAEWAKGTLVGRFTVPIFWSRVRTAAADRDEARLAHAVTAFEKALGTLAGAIRGPYLFGAELTLADIVAGHLLYRYFGIDIPRDPPAGIRAYHDALAERPAYRTHVMIDWSELAHPEAG